MQRVLGFADLYERSGPPLQGPRGDSFQAIERRSKTSHPRPPWASFRNCTRTTNTKIRSEVRLEGLLLCEHHAEQLRLEELVAYWRAIMAHIQLWSGEARSRGRGDVMRLLEIERLRASMDLERASTALQRIQDGSSRDGQDGSGDGRALRPLPPLLLLSTAITG
jgi:hypothetical protein